MKDCIYLTVEQIDALHHLAHTTRTPYGKVTVGVQVEGDAHARSTVAVVATMTDDNNCVSIIEQDGASPGWER